MPWSKLDDKMHEHHKIVAMSDRAYRLFMYSITYASAHHLAGRLTPSHRNVLYRLAVATKKHDDELVALKAWDVDGDDRLIHDFTDYNPSEELHLKRSEAGKRGAASRWQNGKPIANATDGKMANGMAKNDSCARLPTRPDPTQSNNVKDSPPSGGARTTKFTPPQLAEVALAFTEFGRSEEAEPFHDHYTANGWMIGRTPMKDWKAAAKGWLRHDQYRRAGTNGRLPTANLTLAQIKAEELERIRRTGV